VALLRAQASHSDLFPREVQATARVERNRDSAATSVRSPCYH